MTGEQAKAFLLAINCKQIKIKKDWVQASCPLAPWTHENHADRTPSFGLSIRPGERSRYYCFACRSGSVEELLQTLELYTKGQDHHYDFKTARQLLDEELNVLPLPDYSEHSLPGQQFEEWPQYWLDSFVPVDYVVEARDYLDGRGVPGKVIDTFKLRYDSKRQMIVCPYWNAFGRFAGARGRAIVKDVEGPAKHYDYTWQGRNNCGLVWYNEQCLNLSGPVVVVEGQFDVWRTWQVWPKTLGNLTAKPTMEKLKKLGDCPVVVHIPDLDKGGEESVGVWAKGCKELGLVYVTLKLDPNPDKPEEKIDPDKCHPDYLKDKITEAVAKWWC